jgi:cell division protein FtsB
VIPCLPVVCMRTCSSCYGLAAGRKMLAYLVVYVWCVRVQDLVKSYLMIAVQEEVEDLRQRIKMLLERNATLEHENSILRASAPPDMLAKLQQAPRPPAPQ